MRRLSASCVAVAALALAPAAAAAPRALIAVLPGSLATLAADPAVDALGLVDPNVGGYDEPQALLDLTQGARVAAAVYGSRPAAAIRVGRDGRVRGWPAVLARAGQASAEIDPGLLGGAVPGGAAYAGSQPGPEAVVAADRTGRIAAVSLGPARTLTARVAALLDRFRLVVAAVPDRRALDRLLGRRTPDELVLVLEQPPVTRPGSRLGPRLLALGASGLAGGGGTLRSPTTRRPGLVTGIDVAPTVLRWIGAAIPAHVQGQALTRAGPRDAAALTRLSARLRVISGRRWPTIYAFLLGWIGLLAGAAATARPGGVRAALRLGALTALWTPCTLLAAAALRPAASAVEVAVVLGGGLGLALLTDRVAAWPRGPAAPAAAMVLAYAIDLAAGSPLIATSLLGPNPLAGSRFFGIGNELEAALPIVLFAGLAAALPQRPAGGPAIAGFAGAGLGFTALAASGRLGADVGAVFTIGGGTAAGTLALLPGRPSRRAVVLACAVPLLGLAALAGLDLATGAGGHFTRTVLDAGSTGDVADTLRRKLDAAWRSLRRGVMPIDTVVCLAAAVYVARRRERVLGPVAGGAGWRACLVGGFVAGVLGSIFNDSGPQLLVIASFGLVCVVAYIHGRPASYPSLQGN